jgi:hypothetical protein
MQAEKKQELFAAAPEKEQNQSIEKGIQKRRSITN